VVHFYLFLSSTLKNTKKSYHRVAKINYSVKHNILKQKLRNFLQIVHISTMRAMATVWAVAVAILAFAPPGHAVVRPFRTIVQRFQPLPAAVLAAERRRAGSLVDATCDRGAAPHAQLASLLPPLMLYQHLGIFLD
jgi:hypothetical protein